MLSQSLFLCLHLYCSALPMLILQNLPLTNEIASRWNTTSSDREGVFNFIGGGTPKISLYIRVAILSYDY